MINYQITSKMLKKKKVILRNKKSYVIQAGRWQKLSGNSASIKDGCYCNLWLFTCKRTRCDLTPSSCGRSVFCQWHQQTGDSARLPSDGSSSWTGIFVPVGAWAGGTDDGTTEYLHWEVCCTTPDPSLPSTLTEVTLAFLCGLVTVVYSDCRAFFSVSGLCCKLMCLIW